MDSRKKTYSTIHSKRRSRDQRKRETKRSVAKPVLAQKDKDMKKPRDILKKSKTRTLIEKGKNSGEKRFVLNNEDFKLYKSIKAKKVLDHNEDKTPQSGEKGFMKIEVYSINSKGKKLFNNSARYQTEVKNKSSSPYSNKRIKKSANIRDRFRVKSRTECKSSRKKEMLANTSVTTVIPDTHRDEIDKFEDINLGEIDKAEKDLAKKHSTAKARASSTEEKGYMKATFASTKSRQKGLTHIKENGHLSNKKENQNINVKSKSPLENFVYTSKIISSTKSPEKRSKKNLETSDQGSTRKEFRRNYSKPWLSCAQLNMEEIKEDDNLGTKTTTARSISTSKPKEKRSRKTNMSFHTSFTSKEKLIPDSKNPKIQSSRGPIKSVNSRVNEVKISPKVSKLETLRIRQYRRCTHYMKIRPDSAIIKKANADLFDLSDVEEE